MKTAELTVHATLDAVDGAYGTELKDIRPLLDFGHRYGTGAEEHYSLLAK